MRPCSPVMRFQHHGVTQNGARLASEIVTLAEVFRDVGYQTGAFVSSFVLDPRFGWDQGFEHYDAVFPKSGETVHSRGGFWAQHEFDGFDRARRDQRSGNSVASRCARTILVAGSLLRSPRTKHARSRPRCAAFRWSMPNCAATAGWGSWRTDKAT